MSLERLDVFFLIDTRTPLRAGKILGRQARDVLGPGSVALVSPARPAQDSGPSSRQALVGGQLLLIAPSWGCALKAARKDPTGLGVLTEAVLGCSGGDILLIGTYFPCPSPTGTGGTPGSNKLWDKLQQWMHQHNIQDSPSQYLADLITLKTLRHCSRGSSTLSPIALVGGDFNATWADHLGPLKSLGGWASAASLLSPIAQASTDGPEPLYSYYHGTTPKSLIDHLLLSSSCQGHIAFAGVGCGAFFGSISDHRPVLLGLQLHHGQPSMTLGKQASVSPPRSLDLDITQEKLVADYQAYTEGLLTSIPASPSVEEASSQLQTLCINSAAWLQKQGRKKAFRSVGRRHYDGWSPAAMALKAQLVALTIIQGHLHGHRGHLLWRSQDHMDTGLPRIIEQWERFVRGLSWPSLTACNHWMDCTGYPPSYWRTASLREISRPGFCANLIRKVKHWLHGRFREDLRRQISEATRARETLREQGKLKKVIASILQKDTELYALHSIQQDQGILTDAPTIHNLVTEHFTDWYRAPGPSADWPSLLTDREAFQSRADSKLIPPHLTQLLWEAFTFPLQHTALHQDMVTALQSPPSLPEFQAAIRHHKGSTAPGATGLTYNMVKGWPDSVTSKAHQLLTLSFSGQIPAWLQWGWLCPKPKNPDLGITLDGLRPLMLLEVLRKIWVWIIVRKIVRLWESHQILTPSQHGFRKGRGTDSALVVHLNCWEHARLTNTPLFLSSWDIRRAFDSVAKEAMDASWQRLGVPAATAHWIAHLDDHGPTAVRSPWALDAWRRKGYHGLGPGISPTRPGTFTRERGTPQGDVSSPHAWTAFFDIALRALDMTDHDRHFRMPTSRTTSTTVSDIGYADDLVSLSSSLAGLQHKADIMSAFALLFDLTISAPKLRAACIGPAPPNPSLIIHGPGWTPTTLPIRTQGSITILGLTLDISEEHTTQSNITRTTLAQAATLLGYQRVTDTAALVASISTMAKASYTSQFLPWSPQDLQALDVPLNRAFRRLLLLPPTHPNALLYIKSSEGGLGLPRLSDQVNLRKWSMAGRLQERGGLPALAIGGLLNRASMVSGGHFLQLDQGDFIGPHATSPVWGSSLGALGPDTSLRLTLTYGPTTHPLHQPISLSLPRLDNYQLLRSLHRMNLSTWADLTTRASDGLRTWLDLPSLLPELALPVFPPSPVPWPGDPGSSRPGQFWRLTRGEGDWAWGGIYQILHLHSDREDLTLQRWTVTSAAPTRRHTITLVGQAIDTTWVDFSTRCTTRLIVQLSRCPTRGTIRAEFPDTPSLTRLIPLNWVTPLSPLLRTDCSWSIYSDASWREIQPIPAEVIFGIQGSHRGSGALFLSADLPDWCSETLAIRFDIPPTLRSQGGSVLVAELLAIHTGLHLLHTLHLRGTVFSDCLSAVKKITRHWSPGLAHTEAGASLVASCRSYLSDTISLVWIKGHPERSTTPHTAWSRHQWGNYLADGLSKSRDIGSLPFSPIPTIRTHIIPLADILARVPAMGVWQWLGPDCAPPLGNLRNLLSHHRTLAYRANRDSLRGLRGAPPIWASSFLLPGPLPGGSGHTLRSRTHTLRTLWDLRWHGENRAVAAHSTDPKVSACPICHRYWSQAHVLCECSGSTGPRWGGHLDITIAISHLPPGPMLDLGRQFQTLLSEHNQPSMLARRWAGHWDQGALRSLAPMIANCTRTQIKAVLGHILRVTHATTSACWRQFLATARELSPPTSDIPIPTPLAENQLNTLDWDPRLGEDHG